MPTQYSDPHFYSPGAFWKTFCKWCCYRDGGLCSACGLPAGKGKYTYNEAFDHCPLWHYVVDFFYDDRRIHRYTFQGSLKQLHSQIKSYEKRRGNLRHDLAFVEDYDDFRRLLIKLGYQEMYLRWLKSGFDPTLRPTIRRRIKAEGYDDDNIILDTVDPKRSAWVKKGIEARWNRKWQRSKEQPSSSW